MESILAKATQNDIRREPFVHVVVKNALPKELADSLLASYPSPYYLGKGRQGLAKNGKLPNNIKIRYDSKDIINDQQLPEILRDFVKRHLEFSFFEEYMRLLGQDIFRLHPQLESYLSGLTPKDVGTRNIDTYKDKKVLLEAELCVDTPVIKPSSVRSIHLDNARKIGVALLYLRSSDNDSVGGEFEVYKRKNSDRYIVNHISNIKSRYLKNFEKVASIPYEHNTLLMFVNCDYAFHGVSNRQPTDKLRQVFDIAVEVPFELFNISENRESFLIRKIRSLYLKMTGINKELV